MPGSVQGSEVLLLMGPPGAGKGTQSEKLARARNLRKLSTGDMLRDHVKRGTDLGQRARSVMEAGGLVSDDLIIAIVRSELEAYDDVRVLLDGFPRTRVQAGALDRLLAELETSLTAAVLLEVPQEELVRRLVKRAEEENRTDDNEDTVRKRLEVYRQDTQPLADYYDTKGKLRHVDGIGAVEEVFARISEVLP